MIFDELIRVIDDIERNSDEFVLSVIQDPKIEEIVVLFNQDQLNEGFDANFNRIEPEYTQTTVRYKISKGQNFKDVTLKDTGAFHNSIKLIYQRDGFEIVATDGKRRKLKEKYGAAILGLHDKSIEGLRMVLEVALMQELKRRLQRALPS